MLVPTSGSPAANPPRLPPEENVFSCEEASTTQRTRVIRARLAEAGDQTVEQLPESAFRVSGSFSVIVATPESATS